MRRPEVRKTTSQCGGEIDAPGAGHDQHMVKPEGGHGHHKHMVKPEGGHGHHKLMAKPEGGYNHHNRMYRPEGGHEYFDDMSYGSRAKRLQRRHAKSVRQARAGHSESKFALGRPYRHNKKYIVVAGFNPTRKDSEYEITDTDGGNVRYESRAALEKDPWEHVLLIGSKDDFKVAQTPLTRVAQSLQKQVSGSAINIGNDKVDLSEVIKTMDEAEKELKRTREYLLGGCAFF